MTRMTEIDCVRCGQHREGIERAPFRNELGERIQNTICSVCWKEWLAYQTALINHYGLDVREPEAREFLTRNLEAYLFEEGGTEDIDTSQQGNISW